MIISDHNTTPGFYCYRTLGWRNLECIVPKGTWIRKTNVGLNVEILIPYRYVGYSL